MARIDLQCVSRRHALSALGSLIFGSASAQTGAATRSKTHRIDIRALSYAPGSLTVSVGDAVVWTNHDPFPHTVTSPGHFDSGTMEEGASWRFVTVQRAEFSYTCTLHATMRGLLVVV